MDQLEFEFNITHNGGSSTRRHSQVFVTKMSGIVREPSWFITFRPHTGATFKKRRE